MIAPATPTAAISISVDATSIRSREDGERHLEVKVGNAETDAGGRQVFAAVTGSETDFVALSAAHSTASAEPRPRC